MTKFTESELEESIIEFFQGNGYEYVDGESIHRKYDEILLEDDLRKYLSRRYQSVSSTEMEKIINKIKYVRNKPLYIGNREAFLLINEGFDLTRDDSNMNSLHIDYIDFENPENNIFKVVNQYTVQDVRERRPDMLIFINGIPVAIFEFKTNHHSI